MKPRLNHWTKIVSDLDYCKPVSAGPQINKVVIWVAVKYKQTKKSNKVSSWNWAESSHSAVEDAPAAWPKRRKLAFLNAWRTAPRFRSALKKPGLKWRSNRIWFRCEFFVQKKKKFSSLPCSALLRSKALYLKSLLNVRWKIERLKCCIVQDNFFKIWQKVFPRKCCIVQDNFFTIWQKVFPRKCCIVQDNFFTILTINTL